MCLSAVTARIAGVTFCTKALVLGAAAISNAQNAPEEPRCAPSGAVVAIPDLPEGSGVAASRTTPGRLWSHNDSGRPLLVALDTKGTVAGRLQLSGAKVEDWEAIAVGPCPSGSCIHVGDVGDNDAERRQITIYRIPEPADATGSVQVGDVFHATYPDGAHDAESLFVAPDGRMYVVTKGETGPVGLYRFPADLQPGRTHRHERVAGPSGRPSADDRITDAAISPDGEWVVLRSKQALTFHRAAELLAGTWRDAGRVDLGKIAEPQGEGLTFGDGSSVYLVGEGGKKSLPGTFATLTCRLGG